MKRKPSFLLCSLVILGSVYSIVFGASANSQVVDCIKSADYLCVKKLIDNGLNPKEPVLFLGKRQHPVEIVHWFAYNNSFEKKYDENNFVKITDLLLSKGAKFTGEHFPFIVAGGCNQLVEYYLKQGLPVDVNLGGKSMMEIATEENNQELVSILEKYGAEKVEPKKRYTLQLIAETSNLTSLNRNNVEQLLSKGADINGKDGKGTTPLGALVRSPGIRSNGSDIIYLLTKGADPNIQYDPEFQNVARKTYPLNIYIMWSGRSIGSQKRSTQQQEQINKDFETVLEMMLQSGFRIAAKDADMKTPLHYAAQYDFPFGVKLLLVKGAKTTDKDKNGMTPYDLAESADVIRLLK